MMSAGSTEEDHNNENGSSKYHKMEDANETTTTSTSTPTGEAEDTPYVASERKPLTAGDYVEHWSQQVFGEKHPQVKARAQETGNSVKSLWLKGVEKIRQLDEKVQLSKKTSDLISSADQKLKAFDEKHAVSEKTSKQVGKVKAAYGNTVEKVKAYDEQKQISANVKGSTSRAFQGISQSLSGTSPRNSPENRENGDPNL
uniref:Uncharacterized protein n=1 Tax=Grammatophora oceanica TaxID=210454 RepID=A0A6U5JG63_9STRA|mmetsp:Transcript_25536/g.37335  ORF Transcript_25536/g.37335 Transcript_25536/m.37335 type:complete len:200 (+) Transcript_25536:111-710(+)|eukprot:CAMPEP_0194049242 /NCGR_PEP_ID=MMETSP0009_2-20130614/30127_1 /TAXON_ID=210454 /ORGANISM="Grammatophora oceanica, Strain CCMP 410" /LENGTH=199 /DNA_ID=CAMNT_0038695349 /DNA_START=111 /DNA_END=710 /DNA_ORIENTATION=+